ncbi:unnamed protein product [Ectocarpus sp. 12 AP-2014]
MTSNHPPTTQKRYFTCASFFRETIDGRKKQRRNCAQVYASKISSLRYKQTPSPNLHAGMSALFGNRHERLHRRHHILGQRYVKNIATTSEGRPLTSDSPHGSETTRTKTNKALISVSYFLRAVKR